MPVFCVFFWGINGIGGFFLFRFCYVWGLIFLEWVCMPFCFVGETVRGRTVITAALMVMRTASVLGYFLRSVFRRFYLTSLNSV